MAKEKKSLTASEILEAFGKLPTVEQVNVLNAEKEVMSKKFKDAQAEMQLLRSIEKEKEK